MRRFGVLLVLLFVMIGVRALKVSPAGAGDPLTLAAIGFVALAAFTVAEVGSHFSLPRVTGYIVAGLALGPSAANLLSVSVVGEMRMFNTLALGLIAIAAGLELNVQQIRRIGKTLLGTVLVKVAVGTLLVGLTLFMLERQFGLLRVDSLAKLLAMSVLFGVLSIPTSPAIALAVTSELRSKGRMTDLVLGAAVLKDIVVVVGLALAVALGHQLTGGGESAGGHDVSGVAKAILSSLGVGGLVGLLLIIYLRYVHAEMLLFVAATILVVAEICNGLHLEFLLVFITAGFVVRNASRFGHELMAPVHTVSLPVFVVFFTSSGASVNLHATLRVIPLALALALARGGAYYLASRVGGAWGGESDAIKRRAWLAYLPQAGVALGLVGLASQQLPNLAPYIQSLGMALIAIHLLLGPIALRSALRTAGEVPQSDAEVRSGEVSSEGSAEPMGSVPPTEELLDTLSTSGAKEQLIPLTGDLESAMGELVHRDVGRWVASCRIELEHLFQVGTDTPLPRVRDWANLPSDTSPSDRVAAGQARFAQFRQCLQRLPEQIRLPLERRHWQPAARDTFAVRWRKRALRYGTRLVRRPRRSVPLLALVRITLEERLAAFSLEVVNQWNRAEVGILSDLQRLALGIHTTEEAEAATAERLTQLEDHCRKEMRRVMALGLSDVLARLEIAGTPSLPSTQIRYSRVEPSVRATLARLDQVGASWGQAMSAARATLALTSEVSILKDIALGELQTGVVSPISEALSDSAQIVRRIKESLALAHRSMLGESSTPEGVLRIPPDLVSRAFGDMVWTTLERDGAQFGSRVSTHPMALTLRAAIEELPLESPVLDPRRLVQPNSPEGIGVRSLRIREAWTERVLHDLLPAIDEEIRQIEMVAVAFTRRVHEVEEILNYELYQSESEPLQTVEASTDVFQRAGVLLEDQANLLDECARRTREEMVRRAASTFEELVSSLTGEGTTPTRQVVVIWTQLRRWLSELSHHLTRLNRQFGTTAEKVGASPITKVFWRRVQGPSLDALELREQVQRWQGRADLPDSYCRLFSLEPLAGPRHFVAHRAELDALVGAEQTWMNNGPSSALVIGLHGSGRTSLLNLARLQFSAPRMFRPESLQSRRDLGLVGSLALVLGTKANPTLMVRALTQTPTVVVIDDLEQWFTPDTRGLRELERFLDVIVRTAEHTFWLVSIEQSALDLFQEAFSVTQVFGRVVRLSRLDKKDAVAVIESRQTLSGRALRFASTPASRILSRWLGFSDRDVFYRVLLGLSEGNLSRLLALWRRSVTVAPDGEVVASLGRVIDATLPFVSSLSLRDQAILAMLMRFGPLDRARLGTLLQMPQAEARRRLAYLHSAGLLEGGVTAQSVQAIPATVRPLLAEGLKAWQVRS